MRLPCARRITSEVGPTNRFVSVGALRIPSGPAVAITRLRKQTCWTKPRVQSVGGLYASVVRGGRWWRSEVRRLEAPSATRRCNEGTVQSARGLRKRHHADVRVRRAHDELRRRRRWGPVLGVGVSWAARRRRRDRFEDIDEVYAAEMAEGAQFRVTSSKPLVERLPAFGNRNDGLGRMPLSE